MNQWYKIVSTIESACIKSRCPLSDEQMILISGIIASYLNTGGLKRPESDEQKES